MHLKQTVSEYVNYVQQWQGSFEYSNVISDSIKSEEFLTSPATIIFPRMTAPWSELIGRRDIHRPEVDTQSNSVDLGNSLNSNILKTKDIPFRIFNFRYI
jgi:hypothetical protein